MPLDKQTVWGEAVPAHLASSWSLSTNEDARSVMSLNAWESVSLCFSYDRNLEALEWSDIVIATGSTLVNGSIDEIACRASGKSLYFYGVTMAAAAYELGLNRLCYESK